MSTVFPAPAIYQVPGAPQGEPAALLEVRGERALLVDAEGGLYWADLDRVSMLLVDAVAAAHDTAWTTIAETARELEQAAS